MEAFASAASWGSFFETLRQDMFCWLAVYALVIVAMRHRLRPPAARNVALGAVAVVAADVLSAAFMELVPSSYFNLPMLVILPLFFVVLRLIASPPLRVRAFVLLSGAAVASFVVLAVDVALLVMEELQVSGPVVLAVDTALSLALPLSLIPLFGGRMAWAIDEMIDEGPWKGLWIVPTAFCAVAVAVYSLRWEVSVDSPEAVGFYAAACVLLVGLLVVAYRALFATMRSAMENERLRAQAQIGALQAARYGTLRDHMRETSIMRHDFRHRVLMLAALADEGDLDGLRTELDAYRDQTAEAPERGTLCANFAVDAVAAHFAERARGEGATLRCRLDLPERLPVDEADFCMALANLLENAVEAAGATQGAEASRRIEAEASARHGAVVLTVENSMPAAGAVDAGPERLDERALERGVPSTKHEGDGVGLASVAALARKHCGAFRIERGEGTFVASLALPFDREADAPS